MLENEVTSKKKFNFEDFIKKLAEEEEQELKKHNKDGVVFYTLGEPDILRMAKTALTLVT